MTRVKLPILAILLLAGCGAGYAVRHTVAPGEDAAVLAARSGVSEKELRKMNHLEPGDRLRPGDTIFLPGSAPARPSPTPAPPPAAPRDAPRPQPEGSSPQPTPTPSPAPESPTSPARTERPPPTRTVPPAPVPAAPPPRARTTKATPSLMTQDGKPSLRWPVEGEIIRAFGKGLTDENLGIDIGARAGTQVRAAGGGKVIYAGTPTQAYGPLVIVDHGSRLHTVYSNLKELSVRRGDAVESGRALGTVGEKTASPASHVHFEVRRNGDAVDPLLFLPAR